jgi:hypothetical protein
MNFTALKHLASLFFLFSVLLGDAWAQPPFPSEKRPPSKARVSASMYHYMHPEMRSPTSPVESLKVSKRQIQSPRDKQSEAIPMRKSNPSREKPKGERK